MKKTTLPVVRAPYEPPVGLERCSGDEPLHDYILKPYEPLTPHDGMLRSVNLLYASFAEAGVETEGREVVSRLRDTLGPFRTVWGIKHDALSGALRGWELYFYDWTRTHADLQIAPVCDALSELLSIRAVEPRPLPWHMFSIDFGVDALRSGSSPDDAAANEASVHVYIDMRSYALHGPQLTFQNIYTFHDPRVEIDDVMARIRASVHVDLATEPLARLLPPELFGCHKMCVANKRDGDAFYFSRVPTRSLLRFLREQDYPESLSGLIERETPGLAHLLWDVGLDFTATPEGARVRRSGVYGSF
ncbi:MAG: hypothetical protein AB8I08_40375 [Sandaracinaceae bacterium]